MADRDSRAGKHYTSPELLRYTDELHAAHDQTLQEAFDLPSKTDIPAIQLGRSEARFLELLVTLTGAKKIVEVGTLVGYSAIRLARGAGADGHVWTIEYEPRHAEAARERLDAAGVGDRTTVVVGAGAEVLPTLEEHGPFDLVFVDADKASYPFYGDWAAANLREGGLLVGDNAFLFGRLTDDSEDARAMREFHERPVRDGWLSVCVPTPDGMLIARKP